MIFYGSSKMNGENGCFPSNPLDKSHNDTRIGIIGLLTAILHPAGFPRIHYERIYGQYWKLHTKKTNDSTLRFSTGVFTLIENYIMFTVLSTFKPFRRVHIISFYIKIFAYGIFSAQFHCKEKDLFYMKKKRNIHFFFKKKEKFYFSI